MRKSRHIYSLLIFLSFAVIPSLLLPSATPAEDDLNEIAYQNRFLLKAGTVLNSEGKGDCLIFPYYDVRKIDGNSQITEINIENFGENGIAARLRFREWSRGKEIFSKGIWIPSKGVWNGRIESNEEGTNAIITSTGDIIYRSDSNSFYVMNSLSLGVPFSTRNIRAAKGESTLYGYLEVIGEEKTSAGNNGGKVARLAKKERDCPNTLRGTAAIQRIEDAVSMAYDAVAIGNFSRGQGSLFRSPGSPYPRLDNCEDTLDQLEFQLSKWEVFGPYSVTPSNQARTSLILAFPTKFFHYQSGRRANQVNNPFEGSSEASGDPLKSTLSKDGNDLPADSTVRLPFSVNVVGLYKNYFGDPTGIDNVSMSTFYYESGEVKLTADNLAQRVLIQDYEYLQERFTMYRGLPSVGLVLREYNNSGQTDGSIIPVEFSAVWEASDFESVFIPATPNGPSFGTTGVSYIYSVGGSASSLGHPIQYLIDWGDGTNSGWLDVGTTSASKTWTIGGVYPVRAKARCSLHTDIVSSWSNSLVVTIESVSTPTLVTGPVEGIPNVAYSYTASGSVSSGGHPVEYQFDWGDSTTSDWGPGTQSKTWIAGGVYVVKARARCGLHPAVMSEWTSGLTVTIESVSTPTKPTGPSVGSIGVTYSFSTGGAVSNLGHPVQYQFDWGDGTLSTWGSSTQTKSWNTFGDFNIRARARCATDPTVISDWSEELSFTIEFVSAPSQPIGNLNGMRNKPYIYTASGAISTNNHALEYQFDWGDGSTSTWTAAGVDPDTGVTSASQTKVWTSSGTYLVRARARCKLHAEIVSDWSSGLPVVIEYTSTPVTPSGPTSGTVGEGYFYTTGGSTVDSGHQVQYRFDWGDGTTSEWLPVGITGVGKAWTAPGTYAVRAQARCAIHTVVISDWSPALSVTIVPGPPPQVETISTPFIQAQGTITGRINIPYTFTFQSGVSNLGHPVQHQFDWGDGTFSAWGATPTKAWSTPGTYTVRVKARCTQHPSVMSEWSSGVFVVIDSISTPQPPTWDDKPADGLGQVVVLYHFSTAGGSTSQIGQAIQYRFNWGDGSDSGWLDVGTTEATHAYALQGVYTVTVEARGYWYLSASGTTEHISDRSAALMVTIRP